MIKCFNNNIWGSPANLLSLFYSILITTQVWALIHCLWFIPSKEISELKENATPKLLTLRKNLTDSDERSVNVFAFFSCFTLLPLLAFVSTWFQHYAGFWSFVPLSSRCSFSFYCLSLLLSSYFCLSHWRLCSPLARQLCTRGLESVLYRICCRMSS